MCSIICGLYLLVIRAGEINDLVQAVVVHESPTRHIATAFTPVKQPLELQLRDAGPFSSIEFRKLLGRLVRWATSGRATLGDIVGSDV